MKLFSFLVCVLVSFCCLLLRVRSSGFKELFNTSHKIPSIIYSARNNPGTPKVRPAEMACKHKAKGLQAG